MGRETSLPHKSNPPRPLSFALRPIAISVDPHAVSDGLAPKKVLKFSEVTVPTLSNNNSLIPGFFHQFLRQIGPSSQESGKNRRKPWINPFSDWHCMPEVEKLRFVGLCSGNVSKKTVPNVFLPPKILENRRQLSDLKYRHVA